MTSERCDVRVSLRGLPCAPANLAKAGRVRIQRGDGHLGLPGDRSRRQPSQGDAPRSFTRLSYELRPRKKSISKSRTVLAQMTLSRDSRGHCTAAKSSKKTSKASPNMG